MQCQGALAPPPRRILCFSIVYLLMSRPVLRRCEASLWAGGRSRGGCGRLPGVAALVLEAGDAAKGAGGARIWLRRQWGGSCINSRALFADDWERRGIRGGTLCSQCMISVAVGNSQEEGEQGSSCQNTAGPLIITALGRNGCEVTSALGAALIRGLDNAGAFGYGAV